MQQIIDDINDHLFHPEKTEADINVFGFYNSLGKLISHCSQNPTDTKISLQLAELWWVVDDLYNGIVFRRYIRPDENGCLWEYEVDPDDRKVLNSRNLGKHELSRDDKIILEEIERGEKKINNERKESGYTEQFRTHGIHIGDFTKREKYNIHSRLDGFVDQEKWAYERRDSSCKNITTIYQRFDDLKLPRTAHLKYEDYITKIDPTEKIKPPFTIEVDRARRIFNAMNNDYFETDEHTFVALCGIGEINIAEFVRIKWIKETLKRNGIAKGALIEFISLLTNIGINGLDDKNKIKEIINKYFIIAKKNGGEDNIINQNFTDIEEKHSTYFKSIEKITK